MANPSKRAQSEQLQTAQQGRLPSERERFLADILSRHSKELKELQDLEEILKVLPSSNQGFYYRLHLVSNKT